MGTTRDVISTAEDGDVTFGIDSHVLTMILAKLKISAMMQIFELPTL